MKNKRKKSSASGSGAILAAAAVAFLVLTGVGYTFLYNGENLYKDVPVVGYVDGKPVYILEAEKIVNVIVPPKDGKRVAYRELDEASKKMIVREVAAQRAMLKEAKAKGIVEDVELKRKVSEYKNKLIRDQLFAKIAQEEITEEKILAQYKEVEDSVKGKMQVKLSHILLNSEEDAKKAKQALKKRGFSKVAKDYSQDSATKDRDGQLGYMLSGSMDPNFEKAALALKVGGVSGPVQTKFGWHLIKLEEKKEAELPSFASLKQRLAQDLYASALKNYADEILTGVDIELKEDVAEAPAAGKESKAVENGDLSKVAPAAGEAKAEAKNEAKEEAKK